ncbi:MAG TPA: hypothetical protein PLQ97_10115 [Myxococcota bacterium]|nr:hypothetical protein [Myxococcota bacterium]HQK51233.1 hypothetical protein [Myxococcota bacterium]
MRPPAFWRPGVLVLGVLGVLVSPVGVRGQAPEGPVLPPGQEDLFRRILAPDGTPCSLTGVLVDRDRVRGTYRCGTETVQALLRPTTTGPGTEDLAFEVTVSPGHPALERVVRQAMGRLRGQVRVERPAPRESEPPPPDPVTAPAPEFTPEEQVRYDQAEALVKAGRCPEALDLLESMARRRPVSQTLGLMVVCLAADALDRDRVQEEVARAEARPDDPLSAFRAGVISHYAGHRLAGTRAEKAAFYRDAIRFLERTLPAYDHVTRVHLYLAVSHHRLGHPTEAEAAIAKAVALAEGTGDADAWYCRAEVRHRKDLAGALQDIETYFRVMAPNIARGAIHSPAKQRRVREMQARLERARSGEEPLGPDEELFDPLPNPWRSFVDRHRRFLGSAVLLGLAGVLGAVILGIRRRVRRGSGPRVPPP